MGVVAVAAMAVGAAATAYSVYSQSRAQANAYRGQAEIDRYNYEIQARQLHYQRALALREAQWEYQSNMAYADQIVRQAQFSAATQRASAEAVKEQKRAAGQRLLESFGSRAGKAGVVAAEGSLLETELEAARLIEYDANISAYAQMLSATETEYAGELDSASLRSQAELSRLSGSYRANLYGMGAADALSMGNMVYRFGRDRARSAIRQGNVGIATSLIGGASDIYGAYRRYYPATRSTQPSGSPYYSRSLMYD
jgi:hypothetical protein